MGAGLAVREWRLSVPPSSTALETVHRSQRHLPLSHDGLRCFRASASAPPLLQAASFVRHTPFSEPLTSLRGLPPDSSLSVAAQAPGGAVVLLSSDCVALHDLSLCDAKLGRCEASLSATRAQGVSSWEGELRRKPLRLCLTSGESPLLELSGANLALAGDASGRLRATVRATAEERSAKLVLHSGLSQPRPGVVFACGIPLPMDARADLAVSTREPKGVVLEVGRKLPRRYGGSYLSYVQRWGGAAGAPRRQLKLSSKSSGEQGGWRGSHQAVWAEGEPPRGSAEWGGPSADSAAQSEIGTRWTLGVSAAGGTPSHVLVAFSRGFEEG